MGVGVMGFKENLHLLVDRWSRERVGGGTDQLFADLIDVNVHRLANLKRGATRPTDEDLGRLATEFPQFHPWDFVRLSPREFEKRYDGEQPPFAVALPSPLRSGWRELPDLQKILTAPSNHARKLGFEFDGKFVFYFWSPASNAPCAALLHVRKIVADGIEATFDASGGEEYAGHIYKFQTYMYLILTPRLETNPDIVFAVINTENFPQTRLMGHLMTLHTDPKHITVDGHKIYTSPVILEPLLPNGTRPKLGVVSLDLLSEDIRGFFLKSRDLRIKSQRLRAKAKTPRQVQPSQRIKDATTKVKTKR